MFSKILGQESVIASLRRGMADDQLSQTYLFTGEHQLGKTTTAIALAAALLCERRQPTQTDSCGECGACRTVASATHPDVRTVSPTGPSRMLRIAQLWPRDGVKDYPADRAMLRDLHFAPVSGKRRIFIIEAAEAMNEDTANSLLKVLEEPPAYALFILTALSSQAVLPTILSRSQVLRFKPVPETVIIDDLIRRGIPADKAIIFAAYAQGKPGIAIRSALAAPGGDGRDDILRIAEESSGGYNLINAFKIADDLRKSSAKLSDLGVSDDDSSSRSLLTIACDILLLWYRDLLVTLRTTGSGSILNSDHREVISKHCLRYSATELEYAIELIRDTRRYIGRNANAQVSTEYLMLNLLSVGK